MKKLLLIQGAYSWPPLPVMPDGAALSHPFHGFLLGPLDGTYDQDGETDRLFSYVQVNALEDRFGPAKVFKAKLDETAGTLTFIKNYPRDSGVDVKCDLRRDDSGLWLGTYAWGNDGGFGIVRCSVTVTDQSFFHGVRPSHSPPA